MAAGDTKLFNQFILRDRQGSYALADDWRIAFISNTYASVSSDLASPTISSVTVTSGGNVAASYALANESLSRSTSVVAFDADDIGTIAKNASNPTDVRCAVLYNVTVTNELAQIWDMTTDGSTPLDLVNNDFTFSFGASGINTSTNTST